MELVRSPDRLVSLAALGARCVEYRGHDVADAVETMGYAIGELLVRVRGSVEVPSFHPHNSVYGFRRQSPGPCVIEIVDPLGRYLPRVAAHDVDPRVDAFRAAFEQGAVPDTTGWDPVVVVPMYPAPVTSLTSGSTGVYGTVRDGAGNRLPYAHVQWQTASGGHYRTMADHAGDYFARLRDARSGVDAVTGDRDPNITRTVHVHRMSSVPDPEALLRTLPTNFESLRPGMPAFDAVWSPVAAVPPTSIALVVGTLNRVDIG